MEGAAVLPADQISEFVNTFRAEQGKYSAIMIELGILCSRVLAQKDIKFHWEARVKSPESLETKLRQRTKEYDSDDANCKAIKDLIAGRIILPRWSNFLIIENMIAEHFDVISIMRHPKAPWRKKDTLQQRFRDYDGFHFYFKRKPETVTDGLQEVMIEIQVMSPFMWAYQDLQHDVEYKQLSGTPSREERRALEYLRGVANMGEVAIQHFEDAAFSRQQTESSWPTATRTTTSSKIGDGSIDPGLPIAEESLKSLARNLESLKLLQDVLNKAESRRAAEYKENVISWVSSKNVEFDHYTFREKLGEHYHNSGQWFKAYYNDWMLSPEISTLWVTGSVGRGKSSLISNVIEWHYKRCRAKSEQLAIFYCSKGKESYGSRPAEVVRSFVAQLAQMNENVLHTIIEHYEDHKLRPLTLEECQSIIIDTVKHFPPTTFIIDALDECEDEAEVLLQVLVEILNSIINPGRELMLKILLSSRLQVSLPEDFPSYKKIELDREIDLSRGDMEVYIDTQIRNRKLWHLGKRLLDGKYPELEERLIRALSNDAHGMFRWVELQLDIFLGTKSRIRFKKDAIDKLDRLEQRQGIADSTKLKEAYDEVYDNNTAEDSESRKVFIRAIKWMIAAFRPLQFSELIDIACISINEDDTIESDPDAISEGELLRICSNFIIKDQDGVCRFSHISVRDYFSVLRPEFSSDLCHIEIATTCLICLSQPDIRIDEIIPKPRQFQSLDSTLRVYSVLCWPFHWRKISLDKRKTGVLGAIYLDTFLPTLLIPWIESACFLSCGMIDTLYEIRSKDLEAGASFPTNPIFAASVWDFEEVIDEEYIDMENLNVLNNWVYSRGSGRSAVELAYQYGNHKTLKRLLDKGATLVWLTESQGYGTTPLMREVEIIDTTTMDYLLSQMTLEELNLKDPEGGRTALHVAVRGMNENIKLVEALIQVLGSTAILVRDIEGLTPLYHAASGGHRNIVRQLLQHMMPEDVAIGDNRGRSPLREAIDHGHESAVRLILDKMTPGDIALQDRSGATVLHVACKSRYGREQIVPLLLGSGKMSREVVMLNDYRAQSASDIAVAQKDSECFKMLETFIKNEERKICHSLRCTSVEAEDSIMSMDVEV